MKTFSRRFGQWFAGGCSAVALVGAPLYTLAAEADSAPKADSANAPVVQVVKTAAGSLPANYKPSASLDEVIKLAQSGVGDQVLLAFIENSKKEFSPSPEDIIFLNDLGVSEAAIAALIRSQPGAAAPAVAAPSVPGNPVPVVSNGSVPIYTAPPAAPQINGVVAQPAPDAPATVVVVQPPPEQQVSVTQFYDTLAPYGNWVYVADYGYCWQPTVAVVDVGWRPYAHRGRWAFTDAGWYWQSDYSWGWAPFHYGRWWQHPRSGWLWTPDTVWGPSWVSWRQHNDYCGWAPLPPTAHFRPGVGFSFHGGSVGVGFDFGLSFNLFTFVPTRHFVDRRPYAHAIPHAQVTQVFNHSTVVNNYTTINKTTVVNNGIDHKIIARSTTEPIKRVTLRERPVNQTTGTVAPDRSPRGATEPSLYRTHLTEPRPEKVQHVMTELKQHASRVDTGVPAKSKGAPIQPAVREANQKPLFTPRADAVIPKPRSTPSAPVTTEVAPKGKMSDERVNHYINELRTRKEVRPQPAVTQPTPKSATTVTSPSPTQSPSVNTLPPAQPRNVAIARPQNQPQPPPNVAQPAQSQIGGDRANQYVNELKARRETRPQIGGPAPAPITNERKITAPPTLTPSSPSVALPPAQPRNVAVAQPQPQPQPQPRIVQPTVQQPVVQQPRAVEVSPRFNQRAEPAPAPQMRQAPAHTPPPAAGGGAGRQSAPVYVSPPNPPRNEAPASSGRSSGQEGSGRSSGNGKSERNDRR